MPNYQPAGYIQLELYEDGKSYEDLAEVTLPNIAFLTTSISGSGLMGNIEVPIMGMLDNMTMTIKFRTMTETAAKLCEPKKHQLDLRIAEEWWENESAETGLWADKMVVICVPKATTLGVVTPVAMPDTSGEYVVYYYAAYRNGEQLWEIDKRNMKCIILGTDYMEPVRKALGK